MADGPGGFRDFPMPALIAEQSRAWLQTPEAERPVATPRPSATVMLLREVATSTSASTSDSRPATRSACADRVAGPVEGLVEAPAEGDGEGRAVEVFVLRRAAGMAFAAGMLAFPGGGVDPRDADPGLPWAGPSPQEWARRLATDEPVARELVVAAAREVFEECGVLLAGPAADRVVADLSAPSWDEERAGLLDRSQSFAEMLTRLGLVLRTDLLAARGHWTTPTCEPRRYDTRFFAARMPIGQVADDLSTEAEVAGWATPADILASQDAGREVLLPPTQVMVEQLALVPAGGLDAWLARPVPVHPVLPWPVEHSGALWMRSPVDADGHGVPG